jgi:hypothetical protein
MLQMFKIITFRIWVVGALLCSSCAVSSRLQLHEERFSNGRIKLRYHYYLDSSGKEVREGKLERWDNDFGLTGTEEIYKDGKVISGGRIIINQ